MLVVAHGLTGGSHEAYVRAVLANVTPNTDAGGLGFRAVVLNFRGCNGSPVVTPRLYHVSRRRDDLLRARAVRGAGADPDTCFVGGLVRRHQACGAVDIRYISPMQDVWFR